MAAQDNASAPLVTEDRISWERELSRLAGVNSITSSNLVAVVNAMTDAQVAAFVRRWLITGFRISP